MESRMRDQRAAVQALAARGLGLRAIARELGVDRKTGRRFAHATTGDEAVARAISRPTVLDRYLPHLHRRWNEGCHDAAVLHAEITALGYRGSLRTIYRYLQPLRTSAAPAALTPSSLKIGEVTSWLLRRAEDLNGRQQLLADVRGQCSQLDRVAGRARMCPRRSKSGRPSDRDSLGLRRVQELVAVHNKPGPVRKVDEDGSVGTGSVGDANADVCAGAVRVAVGRGEVTELHRARFVDVLRLGRGYGVAGHGHRPGACWLSQSPNRVGPS